MTCSPFDLRDYFLRELPDQQQHQVEAHVKHCQPCREELERLRVTEAALLSLPDEEIPQRIAFVSDKIFEPAPWRRWWAAFWGSASRLGFASAAMLSAAIIIYAMHPAGRPPQPVAAVPAAVAPIVQPISDAEIQARIDAAVTRAVGQVEQRQMEKTRTLVSDLESMRQRLMVAAAAYEIDQKRYNRSRQLEANYGGPHAEEQR
ncbi:MAG TPA: zf-HC2 domain-containing protein [Bryobacteraceae bacterium]|nr:zf-HC2 domain-containing protein [Bryobacteraceae bacterium]